MDGLLKRLAETIVDWKQDRRDIRLLKAYLKTPDTRGEIGDTVLPGTKLLMLLLEKFVDSGLATAEVQYERYAISCTSPVEFCLPASVASRWDMLLGAVAGGFEKRKEFRQVHLTFATEQGDVELYYGIRLPAENLNTREALAEALIHFSNKPFMVVSKTPLN